MVEFLVHQEIKLDVKADVRSQPPGRRLRQDQRREARRRQVVRRQKCLAFVFGVEVFTNGIDAWVQVVNDDARAQEEVSSL